MCLALSIALSVSCSSATKISVTDPEAKILVNGEYLGKGNVTYSDERIVGSRVRILLRKKGCQDEHHYFKRDEEVHAGALISGIFLLVPLFWMLEYKPEHNYDFECRPAES